MTNKKKKSSIKSKKKSIKKNRTNSVKREKVTGDPMPVKPVRPVCEYYNTTTGEIYPKIFFKESWWTKFKRFLGLVP
jgi:hypothetical protein